MKNIFHVLVITIVLFAVASATLAAVPPIINYQGKLLTATGAPVADGPYTMTFAVYATPAGGTPLWSEPNVTVQVKGGLYSVLLGSVVNLPANIFDAPERYFGVKVGADAELAPRQRIASVPFAMQAAMADTAQTANTAAIATTVPDGAITTAKLAHASVTAEKIVAQESWRSATLENGWKNYAETYGGELWGKATLFYKDVMGIVHLNGLVVNGNIGTVIFTLPVGYRPSNGLIVAGVAKGITTGVTGDIACRIDIFPDGSVVAGGNVQNGWISLSAISFRAEQ